MKQKGSIQVGEQEKHEVSFILDSMWGRFSVMVDGKKTQIDGASYITGPFSVNIGEKEHHTVTFQVIIKPFFGAFRKKTIQALVDGKLFKTF